MKLYFYDSLILFRPCDHFEPFVTYLNLKHSNIKFDVNSKPTKRCHLFTAWWPFPGYLPVLKAFYHYFIKRTFVHPFIRLLKVARYSFLKSRKHTLQIQNLVHWYFARRMFCLVYNNFLRIKNCNENVHNCSCYGNNENSNWLLICV